MTPATRRHNSIAAATRPPRAGRAGFTLIEMMVSVTLVLLMMLMFAEIYSLAQNTISTQRGIAENDQKARILSEVLRQDLLTRTFRSVYPFRFETTEEFAHSSPNRDRKEELIAERRGYFSISENDRDNDTDDVLQLTVKLDQIRWGSPGARIFGRAVSPIAGVTPDEEGPEFDDGLLGNSAGASGAAEVSYFMRDGNLYRSVLLIREPYFNPDPSLTQASPPNWPATYARFWNEFDYSACRWPTDTTFATYEPEFHGPASLSNDSTGVPLPPAYAPVGGAELRLHQSLGAPYLRFGHEFSALGIPVEYRGAEFFGRFLVAERAGDLFAFPGTGVAPFDNNIPADGNGDGLYDFYSAGLPPVRRGVDLMLPNVHAFDIEVWDDIVGDFVDLGHDRSNPDGINPYLPLATQSDPAVRAEVSKGFYHADKLRVPMPGPPSFTADHSSITTDFGNRFDTWHPRMYIRDPSTGNYWRTGRAPYRPRKGNPDPNTAAANSSELLMPFGNERLDLDLDGLTYLDGDAGETDAEAPLRAIRIKIRYIDPASGQLRQSTVEHSLID